MNQLPDAVKNQSLFSNYYLDSLIVEQSQWTDTPHIESDYAAIKQRFDAIAPNAENISTSHKPNAEFIQPVLEQLGHIFEVQPSLRTRHREPEVPDYAFFESEGGPQCSSISHQHQTNSSKPPSLSATPKKWSRNLDRKTQDGGDLFNNQNPNYQIDTYLRGARIETGAS